MKTTLMFYLLVCCGAVERFTEKLVDLGQNVTLQCQVDVKKVYWFLVKPPEAPVYILHSPSSIVLKPQYRNQTFKKTFSVQYNSSLFIRNISTNELELYFCVQSGSPSGISPGIRLYARNHPAALIPENQTCKADFPQCQGEGTDLFPIPLVSGIMNVALLIAVTAFAVHHFRWKSQEQTPDPEAMSSQDNDEPEYSQVNFIPNKRGAKTKTLESEYALVQLPNQRSPRDK